MSDEELYVIELDGDGGDATTIRKLLQCTCSDGVLDVLCRDITDMRKQVRCKECRYACEPLDARGRWLVCDMGSGKSVGPDDFCSFGEPMEDGDGDA